MINNLHLFLFGSYLSIHRHNNMDMCSKSILNYEIIYSARYVKTHLSMKSGFLKGCKFRHYRGVNFNSCLFLQTRAIALVLKKRGLHLYLTSSALVCQQTLMKKVISDYSFSDSLSAASFSDKYDN